MDNIRFPIPQDPNFRKCLTDTIIDGELVLDKEPDGTVSQIKQGTCRLFIGDTIDTIALFTFRLSRHYEEDLDFKGFNEAPRSE